MDNFVDACKALNGRKQQAHGCKEGHKAAEASLLDRGTTRDVIRAGNEVARAELALMKANNDYEASWRRLRAVIGKPDPERTEIVKAFIVLAGGFEPTEQLKRELQDHTKQATAPYKYPREIEFMEELPKTASGKVLRTELRKRN